MLELLYSRAINNEITRKGKAVISVAIDLESEKSGNSDTESVIKHLEGVFNSLTLGQVCITGEGQQKELVYLTLHLLRFGTMATAYYLAHSSGPPLRTSLGVQSFTLDLTVYWLHLSLFPEHEIRTSGLTMSN